MKKPKCLCGECGATVVEYKHSFSKQLADALNRLFLAGGEAHLLTIGLSHNQWSNFQKLQYWYLVQNHEDDHAIENGAWRLTPLGWDFVRGQCQISKFVWTYRAKTVRCEGRLIWFSDDHSKRERRRKDYADDAVPHTFEEV